MKKASSINLKICSMETRRKYTQIKSSTIFHNQGFIFKVKLEELQQEEEEILDQIKIDLLLPWCKVKLSEVFIHKQKPVSKRKTSFESNRLSELTLMNKFKSMRNRMKDTLLLIKLQQSLRFKKKEKKKINSKIAVMNRTIRALNRSSLKRKKQHDEQTLKALLLNPRTLLINTSLNNKLIMTLIDPLTILLQINSLDPLYQSILPWNNQFHPCKWLIMAIQSLWSMPTKRRKLNVIDKNDSWCKLSKKCPFKQPESKCWNKRTIT